MNYITEDQRSAIVHDGRLLIEQRKGGCHTQAVLQTVTAKAGYAVGVRLYLVMSGQLYFSN